MSVSIDKVHQANRIAETCWLLCEKVYVLQYDASNVRRSDSSDHQKTLYDTCIDIASFIKAESFQSLFGLPACDETEDNDDAGSYMLHNIEKLNSLVLGLIAQQVNPSSDKGITITDNLCLELDEVLITCEGFVSGMLVLEEGRKLTRTVNQHQDSGSMCVRYMTAFLHGITWRVDFVPDTN